MTARYDLQLSRGFSAGNYANAYETTNYSTALARLSMNRSEAYLAAFTLGFFSSYELHEMGQHSEAYEQALASRHGKRCIALGYVDDPSRTFTLGTTPAALITRLCREQCPDGYPMTLRSQAEWSAISAAWNQGIDSHLEAITTRSTADASTGKVNVHPEELHVLLRRLFEDGSEEAWSLRSDILSTLGVEEI